MAGMAAGEQGRRFDPNGGEGGSREPSESKLRPFEGCSRAAFACRNSARFGSSDSVQRRLKIALALSGAEVGPDPHLRAPSVRGESLVRTAVRAKKGSARGEKISRRS